MCVVWVHKCCCNVCLTQDMSKLLYDRALSYLNIDIAVYGNDHVRMLATPLLYSVIYKATNMVCNVHMYL